MSTELNTVETKTLHSDGSATRSEINFTTFYQQRGRVAQMTVSGGIVNKVTGTTYVQLDVDSAIQLRKELTRFIEKEY